MLSAALQGTPPLAPSRCGAGRRERGTAGPAPRPAPLRARKTPPPRTVEARAGEDGGEGPAKRNTELGTAIK